MAVYTVHEPPARGAELRAAPDRFRFVRDGFHFWAFLLTPLWMLWHRLWLALVAYVVLAVALSVVMFMLGVPQSGALAAQLLLSLLVGLEAGSLRRWGLRRRGWRQVGLVSAPGIEDAERRFFDRWEASVDPVPPPSQPPSPPRPPETRTRVPPPSSDIIGVFPEPGVPR